MDSITFFKNIKEGEWDIQVTKKWRVKDVLAHLIGWDREVVKELINVFNNGAEPWFMLTDNYNEFNEKIFQEFKNYSPAELLIELEKWENDLDRKIKEIGEDKIRQRNMDWVFDEEENSHFEHHMKQIEKVLE